MTRDIKGPYYDSATVMAEHQKAILWFFKRFKQVDSKDQALLSNLYCLPFLSHKNKQIVNELTKKYLKLQKRK